jgi:opacity protein-like surface antigen
MKKAATLIAVLVSIQAHANSSQDVSGFYLGGGMGNTTYSDDSPFTHLDADGTTFKIIGGYQFNRIVGIEAQYTDYGDIKVKNTPFDLNVNSASVAANIGYTFDNGLRPFATLGLGYISVDVPEFLGEDENELLLRVGAGLEYTPHQFNNIIFRAAYEMDHFNVGSKGSNWDTNIQVGSFYAGATYKF